MRRILIRPFAIIVGMSIEHGANSTCTPIFDSGNDSVTEKIEIRIRTYLNAIQFIPSIIKHTKI